MLSSPMETGRVTAKIKEGVFPGNRVYVPTPEHGFVEAEVVKVSNKQNKIKKVTLRYIDDFIKETYGDDDVVYMESNIQKIVPKGDETVRPLRWDMQNRKSFPEWVTKTFIQYNSCNPVHKNKKEGFQLFAYQEFIRDYLGHNSPYRGILLYHGLGSGKCVLPDTVITLCNESIQASKIWKKYSTSITLDDVGEWSSPKKTLRTFSYDADMGRIVQGTIRRLYRQKVNEDILLICLENGSSIRITKAHHLYDGNEWTNNFEVGDYICVPSNISTQRKHQEDYHSITRVKVKSIKVEEYEGWVYDFEVGQYHNYVANEILCHNTCASIGVSENLKDTRNIVVLLPASLKNNFITDGLKRCGDPLYKDTDGNRFIQEKYSFVSYNSSNVIKQIDDLGSLDNKIIIVDEAHNLATMMVNGLRGMGRQGAEVYKNLLEAKNSKFIFLSGTPLVNTPFEIAVLFNILRGFLEVTMFAVRKFSEATIDQYLAEVIEDERIGYVDFERRNRSLQAILKVKSWDMEFEQTVRFLERKGKEHGVFIEFTSIDKYTVFPADEEEFNTYFVKDDEFINKTTFQRRILGLVSYYKGQDDRNDKKSAQEYPDLLPEETIRVRMSPHQFEIYEMARQEERKKERRAAYQARQKKQGVEAQTSTLARVFSREFSNFVFPDSIIRPFKAFQFISASLQKEKDEEIRRKLAKGEITEEEAKKLIKPIMSKEKWESQLIAALHKISDPNKPYLKPGKEGLNRYSPKMLEMLKEIEKDKRGLILVYSAFRKVEGLEIFARILEANGFFRFLPGGKMRPEDNYKRFTFYSGEEDFKDRAIITKLFTSSDNKEGKLIRILLTSAAGTEGLDLKNIRKVLIMEPYWHEIRIRQVIGRAVRKNSHKDLPEKDRNVAVFRYISELTPEQKTISNEKLSTDEYVLQVAKKKEALNQEVLAAVQKAAVDCTLNQCANDMKGKCFKFAGDKSGLAYLPDLTKDIVFGYEQTKTRTITRKVVMAGITKDNQIVYKKSKDGPWYLGNGKKFDGKPKIVKDKRFALDPSSMNLYDYETLKRTGNLSMVGKVSAEGLIVPL